jgi:hypothetical protein
VLDALPGEDAAGRKTRVAGTDDDRRDVFDGTVRPA